MSFLDDVSDLPNSVVLCLGEFSVCGFLLLLFHFLAKVFIYQQITKMAHLQAVVQ